MRELKPLIFASRRAPPDSAAIAQFAREVYARLPRRRHRRCDCVVMNISRNKTDDRRCHAMIALMFVSLSACASTRPADPFAEMDDKILNVLRSHKSEVASCIALSEREDRNLSAPTLTIKFVIIPTGETSSVSASPEEVRSTWLATCVVETVKTWTFPRVADRDIPVDFPVRFPPRSR
jgi:hypothetical protein